ncbi:hypothetical protein [Terracoccus luteus]|uniref:Uncharacterized protein n=1 Tax=Terracoccus luteus TaxID=53356 RepID=A0A495Y2N5_9MICO|nr:hypothetical protein [Terracoccus luteus]MBB2986576.1 hypothetical protein [Terracoccus luteus]MCP2171835.1 hypothetical protein [Terracoccus luteus]RKT79326.1 hypothetical protein DFJ68_2793 [Terracoccus luteus]
MLTSRGWRVSPAAAFVAVLLAVAVFLATHPAWDSAEDPAPVGYAATGAKQAPAQPRLAVSNSSARSTPKSAGS